MFLFLFFFSSRRRHTRCGRDWSSDVCSSDLGRRIDTDDGALTTHPVRALRVELFQNEVELDRLHEAERLVGLDQDARLAEVDRPTDAPRQQDQQADVVASEAPAFGATDTRPATGGAVKRDHDSLTGEGGTTHCGE